MRSRFVTMTVLAALALAARAQAPGPAVGIDEHLGAQVPLDVALKDEQGREVKLGDLIDKPTVLTLNYFRCAGICSPLLNGIVDVVGKSDMVPGKDFQVLTVSFDPTDGPDLAARKKANYLKQLPVTVPPEAWRFLTGDGVQTRRLADAVGFGYRAETSAAGTTEYVHPAAIFILSPKGKVIRYMYGITYLPFDLKMAVSEANAGRPGPTINKLLKFCYSYDPQGRKYELNVTRVAGVLILLFAGVFAAAVAVRRKPAAPAPEGRPE